MAVMVPMMLAIAAQALTNGPTAPATWPPGTIGVHLIDEPADRRLADQPFVDAVSHALAAANFVPLDAGHGRYVAEVTVTRRATGAVASDAKEPPPSVGEGNWTVHMGVHLPSGKTALRGLIVTQLNVRIRLRGTDRIVWQASALTAQVEGPPAGVPAVIAGKLADALIARFPDPVSGPIAVP